MIEIDGRVFLRKIYNCTIPLPSLPYLSFLPLPFPTLPPPLPLLARVRGYTPEKNGIKEMLVGKF